MTIQEFAKMLDGREMGNETTGEERKQARELGFVIVFGYSDDNAMFQGAISDTVGCPDGDVIYVNEEGVFRECDCGCKYSGKEKDKCKTIEAVWHNEGEYCWSYEADIPYAVFNIMEDGTGYCKGIVFDIKSLGE